eukprot:snap_masked-scaffold_8-processed-gene-8.44-mRNA-1 protein AED:1.00 eAED:1.00 QI:0/-1/0/0/-1/1/1/0/364
MDLFIFKVVFNEGDLQRRTHDYRRPVIFEADEQPDEFEAEEIGYGENSQRNDTKEEERIKLKIETKIKDLVGDYDEEDIVSLKNVLLKRYEAFGDKESPARMSKLEPIFCHVIPDAVFPVDPSRNYGPTMLGYLRAKLESMEKRNLIRRSRNPKHGCQTFLVPKKGSEKYRMVTNMKPLNRVTIKTPLTMPNLEQQVFVPMGSSYYGVFDILSGFDYMPVHEESMHYFTIITPIGAHEMVGSPMGWVNTPKLLQERMQTKVLGSKFMRKDEGAICWIDDIVIYSSTFQKYLENLSEFLERFISLTLRLNIDKCFPLQREVEWCGRNISHRGWNFSSKYFDKILDMKKPYYCHQLAQALHLANWL